MPSSNPPPSIGTALSPGYRSCGTPRRGRRIVRIAWLAAVVLTASLLRSAPVAAQVFFPPPPAWVGRVGPAPTPTPPPSEYPGLLEMRRPIAPGEAQPTPTSMGAPVLGLSLTFAERSEDLRISLRGQPGSARGSTDVSAYLAGFDAYVLGCSLSPGVKCFRDAVQDDDHVGRLVVGIGAVGGYADGSSELGGGKVNLHGPIAGASSTLYLQTPLRPFMGDDSGLRYGGFLLGGFQYTATDFSALENWIHSWVVRPRTGVVLSLADGRTISLYGGASWESFTEHQTLQGGLSLNVEPERPWAGLAGAAFANIFGPGPLEGVSLTTEGEMGNRTGVVVSVRYAFGPRF